MSKPLNIIFEEFNFSPNTLGLFEEAFTHSSLGKVVNCNPFNYERLEFLGDSILGSCVATLAYNAHPNMSEGDLTKLKASLVSSSHLASLSIKYHFDSCIVVGRNYSSPIKESKNLLEDVFEAFIGATYLDQGMDFVFNIVKRIFNDEIVNFNIDNTIDYKSKIQELFQADHRSDFSYRVLEEKGPSNDPHFVIGLFYENILLGKGEGHSKKEAEQQAAKMALLKGANK